MRQLKTGVLSLLTLLLVVLGASMPWLTARMQDAQVGRLQERLELNAVSLTLRQDAGVGPALKVVSEEHTTFPWEEQTQRTMDDALGAAREMIERLHRRGLLSNKEAVILSQTYEGQAEPCLLITEDGSSALVWNCFWEGQLVLIDDASGKAVAFLISNPALPADKTPDAGQVLMDNWSAFFEDYYGMELTVAENLTMDLSYNGLHSNDTSQTVSVSVSGEPDLLDGLNLNLYGEYVAFNF